MIITLKPGETINIELQDSDGGFSITYGKNSLIVKETQNLPDDKGRKGILYRENFGKIDLTGEEKWGTILEIKNNK